MLTNKENTYREAFLLVDHSESRLISWYNSQCFTMDQSTVTEWTYIGEVVSFLQKKNKKRSACCSVDVAETTLNERFASSE